MTRPDHGRKPNEDRHRCRRRQSATHRSVGDPRPTWERDVINGPVELLAALADAEAVVWPAEDGNVTIKAPGASDALRRATRRYMWVLSWGLNGASTGYRWFACDTCGVLAPMSKKPGKACIMTTGCKGRSEEIPLPRFALGAPASAGVPESAVR